MSTDGDDFWLPSDYALRTYVDAPLTEALRLTPGKLRDWSAEALALAIPPMRLAKHWLKPE